jgi:hypothetical protein
MGLRQENIRDDLPRAGTEAALVKPVDRIFHEQEGTGLRSMSL